MTTTQLKTIVMKDWPSRLILSVLIAVFGFAYSQSKTIVHDKVIEIVHPEIDSLSRVQEMTDRKIESVRKEIKELNGKVDALISILVESSPTIKKAAQARVQKNKDSQDVKDALTGETR